MKLLVDTDAFCKLGIAGLLADAVGVLGGNLSDCGRLPALPHMLRRGKLVRHYGLAACNGLIPLAQTMPSIPQANIASLEPFASIDAIDPGEAQLFAAATEFDLTILSGDKRALRALKPVLESSVALSWRVVVLEATLLALCDQLGSNVLKQRVAPLISYDRMMSVCFSPGNPDPRECLRSYYKRLAAEVHPLLLWDPSIGTPP